MCARNQGNRTEYVSAMECAGPATVVFDSSLTAYDFGPAHPMSPIRVDLTMRLARDLGVLDDARALVPAPFADDELIATIHDDGFIDAVNRAGKNPESTDVDDHGLGTDDNPVFADMHLAAAHVVGASRRGVPPGAQRREPARRQHRRRPAPRDARPRQRLLHLQRHRRRHPVAARPGRRAGRLRRRRRAPRRRRPGDLLRRPAGADDLPARDRPDAVPRHRLPAGHRRPAGARARRSTWRCLPAPPTPAGCGRSTRSCRRWCARSRRRCW